MRRKGIILAAAAVLVLALSAAAWAASSEPGSSSDPAVTKSYVDAQIATLKSSLGTGSGSPAGAGAEAVTFTVVEVDAGQTIYGAEGTELILRSGTAKTVLPGTDGIPDLTAGKDLAVNGATVPSNHYLLIPRADGRGIRAESHLYVMIKGAYEID